MKHLFLKLSTNPQAKSSPSNTKDKEKVVLPKEENKAWFYEGCLKADATCDDLPKIVDCNLWCVLRMNRTDDGVA